MKTLTIAIPTYNRAAILKKCLSSIFSQINGLEKHINILVSDNNSDDNTFDVVNNFILSGHDLIYNKNKSNIGMDMNFKYCFNNCKSKYVWILGDDDFILDGSLIDIINILKDNNLGILFLETRQLKDNKLEIYTNPSKLLSDISFYITFISSVIVNTNHIKKVNFEKYQGSFLNYLQVYLDGIFLHPINAKYNKLTMNISNDISTTGGYNVFIVFVKNYLKILKDYRKYFSLYYYELEKFKLLKSFVRPFMLLAVQKKETNFTFKGYVKILFKKYWYLPYFYFMWFYIYITKIINK
ncbi:glycosyltransferase family 2 protein [bacterium]|nr:glycosyltransferase family 2 protein [bacterium]